MELFHPIISLVISFFCLFVGQRWQLNDKKVIWMATSPASNDHTEMRRCRRSLNSIEPRVSDSSWSWLNFPKFTTYKHEQKKTKEKGDVSVHCSITRGKTN